jgi:hypothetical protein
MEKIRRHSAIAIGKAHGKPVLESAAVMAARPIKEGESWKWLRTHQKVTTTGTER